MKTIHPGFRIAGIALGLFLGRSCLAQDSGAAVDLRPAIEVGNYRVSRYLFSKYFNRFAEGLKQREHRSPTAAEARAWADLFVAQQTLVAEEEASGAARRPEIVSTVSRMERHMMTQVHGPLYDRLMGDGFNPSDAELRALYGEAADILDATIVRFPRPSDAAPFTGPHFEDLPTQAQTARMAAARDADGVLYVETAFQWPFLPFSEISAAIESAPEGRWVRRSELDYGDYFIFVRSRRHRSRGDWTADKEAFRAWAGEMNRQAFAEARRTRLLQTADFRVNPEVEAALLNSVRHTSDGMLASAPSDTSGNAILFTYLESGVRTAVSVAEVRTHDADAFIHSPIRSEAALRHLCGDMAMEELDYRSAKQLGVDQTPQFTQDRAGFTALQVLDRYEREELAPKFSPDERDMERYYFDHADDFKRVTQIRGRFLRFNSMEEASHWKFATVHPASPDADKRPVPASSQSVEFAAGATVPGFEGLRDYPFKCPEGASFGPVADGGGSLVFVKDMNLKIEPAPLEEVRGRISAVLLRKALDAKELQLAGEISAHLRVTVAHDSLPEPVLGFADPRLR